MSEEASAPILEAMEDAMAAELLQRLKRILGPKQTKEAD